MKKRPLILLTNDDGITAPGLRTLIKVMNRIGEVVVVAPDSPQSGMGHAITVNDTLYFCIERVCDFADWPLGHLYLTEEKISSRLMPTGIWHVRDPGKFDVFQKLPRTHP